MQISHCEQLEGNGPTVELATRSPPLPFIIMKNGIYVPWTLIKFQKEFLYLV